jgi:two-component system capsular synthesis sensor histidine kinase RcsC
MANHVAIRVVTDDGVVLTAFDRRNQFPGQLGGAHPINRRLLADQLGSLGYQCKTANDGVDALNVLSKNHIDIVLSDVNMPNMDGYRLTQRIRQLGLTLPVVGVTANALAEEKQRCLESGMDSCLSKPVTLDVLKQTLAVYADRVRKTRV